MWSLLFLCRSDVRVEVDVLVPSINFTSGVLIAARMDQGGCTTFLARGVFLFLLYSQDQSQIIVSYDLGNDFLFLLYTQDQSQIIVLYDLGK